MSTFASKAAVSLVQFDALVMAPAANLDHMRAAALEQIRAGADMIVFPELSNTGYVEPLAPGQPFSDPSFEHDYGQQLYLASEPVDGPYTTMLKELAIAHRVCFVVGLSMQHPTLRGGLYNASLLVQADGSVAIYNKMHRWHMEKLYFIAGTEIGVHQTPLGKVGMQVCYDIRFPELTRSMALRGADIITNVWASFRAIATPATDPDTFIHRAYTRAIENGVFFLSCNRAGKQGDFQFLGHSCIVAPDGTVLARSTSEAADVVQAELDLMAVSRYRSYTGLLTDRRPDLYDDLCRPL